MQFYLKTTFDGQCRTKLFFACFMVLLASGNCCFISSKAKVGQSICSFVIRGYRLEIVSPTEQFELKNGELILKDNLEGKERTFSLTLAAENDQCHWRTDVTLHIVPPDLVKDKQRYTLWPECIPSHQHNRGRYRRAVSFEERKITVAESTPIGNIVHTLTVEEPVTGEYKFSIQDELLSKFSVNSDTGELTLKEKLNWEENPVENVVVIVQNESNLDDVIEITVVINVLAWTMPAYPYLAVVPTDAPNEACIYKLSASVGEDSSEINYFLRAALGNATDRFKVDATSGCVLTIVSPDTSYTLNEEYLLSVYARDMLSAGDSAILTAEVTVFGQVHDPQFTREVYEANVLEGEAPQTVLTVEALSFNIKLAVRYDIEIPEGVPYHTIDRVSGVITLESPLDRESMDAYYLTVFATENIGNGRTTSARVNVFVTDVNDCVPDFGQSLLYLVDIREDISSLIYPFEATDCDEGENAEITYSLSGSDASSFIIENGTLYASDRLDFDQRDPWYQFVVQATDGGSPALSSSMTVFLEVVEVNDEVPIFNPESYIYYVDEDIELNFNLGAVYASDQDNFAGEAITFGENCAGSIPFSVGPTSGVISKTTSSDLTEASYVCNISATDTLYQGRQNVGYGEISIIVNDINDNVPVFPDCATYNANVSEVVLDDTVFFQVSATDDDRGPNGEVSYSLTQTDTPFAINSQTGEIYVLYSRRMDRESIPFYDITVVASDKSPTRPKLDGFCDFTVTVDDVNDERPIFRLSADEYSTLVPKDTPMGTTVVKVEAEDPDVDTMQEIVYSLVEESQFFQIIPVTGEIVTKDLSEAGDAVVDLMVTASDGKLETTITVQMEIGDSPVPAPTLGTYDVQTIQENVTIATSVLRVEADTSHLTVKQVVFSLATGARPQSNSLDSFTLQNSDNFTHADILVGPGGLDYETVSQVTLTVSVVGQVQYSLRSETPIVFNIEDVNDNPPKFQQSSYDASVAENAEVGREVLQVSATDADSTPLFKQSTYSISSQSPYFEIDAVTGIITTKMIFDREESNELYTINVVAENVVPLADGVAGINRDVATVSVYILDLNDNKPFFALSSYDAFILETANVGSEVTTVTASDNDTDSTLQYFISAGNDKGTFRVDPDQGMVFLARPLDYESQSLFLLEYKVTDGRNEETVSLEITVGDVNDEAPEFEESEYTTTVAEGNTSPVNPIITVSATDKDGTQPIEYSLQGDGANNVFVINPATGEINLNQVLDREDVAVWYLVAEATDPEIPLSSYAGITVTVSDINDNGPYFPLLEYVGYVAEGSTGGTSVMTVIAQDDDEQGGITYNTEQSGSSNDGYNYFEINQEGLVTVQTGAPIIDREATSVYYLAVSASDGENSAMVNTTIYVTDINDEQPEISPGPYTATVPEDTPVGETVLAIPVTDPDIDFRDQVQFSIQGGNLYFDIYSDEYTLQGLIYVAQALNFESNPGPFSLSISVSDGIYTDTTTATITVTDVEEPPKFTLSVQSVSISENAALNDLVASVSATDDEGDGYSFSIDPTTDPDNTFVLRSTGGDSADIRLNKALDRESVAEYNLIIVATADDGLESSASIQVIVEDVNDEEPYFSEDYSGTVDPEGPSGQWIAVVSATDDDENVDGVLFEYSLASSGNIDSYFNIFQNNDNNTATIRYSGQPINTDSDTEFVVVVSITDNGIPPNTGSGTVLVQVYVNNFQHEPATKEITVYSLEGNIPTTPIGTVPCIDEDPVNDKSYEAVGTLPRFFLINEYSGELTILEGTPSAVYDMEFTVSDDGTFDPVISAVTVTVVDISREAVDNSGSVRFNNILPSNFISDPVADGTLPYIEQLSVTLSELLGSAIDDIAVFSVLTSPDGSGTNVRYSVTSASTRRKRSGRRLLAASSEFYSPEYLDAIVLQNLDAVENDLGLTISMVSIDACIPNPCTSECTSVLTIDTSPVTINADYVSMVSINSYESSECSCIVRSSPIGGCLSTTCRNGGSCKSLVSGDVGYQCSCSNGFEGPECQRLSRTFTNGFAWFEGLRQCEETHTSIEFLTQSPSGTLLYSGPLTSSDESQDFILVELNQGKPRVTLNLGSGNNVISLNSSPNLSDNEWHKLDIFRTATSIEVVVDACGSVQVTEDHSESISDESSCKITAALTPSDGLFTSNRPLQLGGVDPSSSWSYPSAVPSTNAFSGCIRNLIQDGKLYDMAVTYNSVGSEPGCALTDENCVTSDGTEALCVGGTCVASVDTAECVCNPGWTGERCNQVVPEEYDFAEASYVTYGLVQNLPIDPRISDYFVMVRTREPTGLIWTIANENTYEHITLELQNGLLQASWHLGDGTVTDSLPYYPLSNGEWHSISFKRVDNIVTIKVDGGGSSRELTNQESQFKELVVDRDSLKIGAMVVREVQYSENFLGCIQDPRLNNKYLGIMTDTTYATPSPSDGVSAGCLSESCVDEPCNATFECVDIWREYECRCSDGFIIDSGICVPAITCVDEPCLNGGTCIPLPDGFECECLNGFTGIYCEIESEPVVNPELVLSTGAIVAICLCLLLLLILLLLLLVFKRKVDHRDYNKHLPEDDIWEETGNHDEEGEEADNDGFDISILTATSARRSPREEVERIRPVDEPEVVAETLTPAQTAITFGPNVWDYLTDRKATEDANSDANPKDEALEFNYEGDGSSAGSLSSLNSSSTNQSDQDWEYLRDLGAPFRRLADIYGHDDEQEPSVRLSFSSADA
ncbi:Neural-cadherin [Holothuria leucospilota]|uniref:Neural-cadherin n=1 Tax=Holothuria leucospilota TaxID=206669 RepID=A0A9Q1HDR0_HOLLE|nr:Neural-cadherin [Holothuria leucospilota]